ncbi:MAG: hypothetical protein ACYCVD_17250 [Desulfitobacteriaceae bacterium]
METRKIDVLEPVETINLEFDESKTLPTTDEMLMTLKEDPSRCLSWL